MTVTQFPWAARAATAVWLRWPAACGAIALAMLAAAHAFETFGKLEPCALCLRQREVYWAALAVAALGAVFWLRRPTSASARVVEAVLGGVFLTGAVIAVYHAGVEQLWWPGPSACSSSSIAGFSVDDVFRSAPPVTCDSIPWSFAGLSMAAWNALISAALAAISLRAASRGLRGVIEEPSL